MLVHLRIRGLVLIESLELPLAAGFNVLTGETGAGKSLVATAVGLLLGRRAAPEIVRRGAEEAEVEGLFDVSDEPAIHERLTAAGLPAGDELLIRRVVPADGRQRSFVNGRLASLALLIELAEDLASFSGQHEHLALVTPGRQLALLDEFGAHANRLDAMATAHAAARAARERYETLLGKERDRAERLDWLAFQVREIDDLAPAPDEIEALARESARLRHTEELLAAAAGGAEELYERDGSLYERLSVLAQEIERAARHDAGLAGEAARLADAASLVEEAARALADYAGSLEAEPGRLDEVEERRAALQALVAKHGLDLPELLTKVEGMRVEVEELSGYEEALGRARAELDAAREAARAAAAALTAARRKTAKRLAKAVRAELEDLALGDGAFEVDLSPADGEPGPAGADRVEFLVSLNPGEGTHPIAKVASGGELSRLMLAVRRAVAGVGPAGTWVFDEVDAGIGGTVASAVARKLREVAAHHQVISITHLPQIAGRADAHFVVSKREADGRTVTEVRRLDADERVQEIARMLGGETLTEKTKAAAREILSAGPR